MEYLVTAEEMKRYDQACINRIGIPSLVLMERAALAVAEEVRLACRDSLERSDVSVLILSGCGNNGADGLALARILAYEFQVEVVIVGDPKRATAQWAEQYQILQHFPVRTGSKPIRPEYDMIVDALFGVGLSRDITGEYADWVHWMNEKKGWKIAVDMPSGIHSDTGRVMGCAVRADLTVCFAYGKRGLFFYPGCEYAGEVRVKDIGIGEASFFGEKPSMFRYTQDPRTLLPAREQSGNKGTFGKVLLAAGSKNMAGAAVLSAVSCYLSGVGMVKVLTPECNREILQTAVPEALLSTYETEELPADLFVWPDILAIGPGLGIGSQAYGVLKRFLEEGKLPIVIDADGLNLLAMYPQLMELIKEQGEKGRSIILTPHVGELSRLCGISAGQIKENPVEIGMGLAQKLNCVIVCKDARTLICGKDKPICMNTTGNSGMAVAGSGDVLTGIIAGMLAQGLPPFEAACTGVYLHGSSGEKAAAKLGEYSMTAGDIARAVAEVTRPDFKNRR